MLKEPSSKQTTGLFVSGPGCGDNKVYSLGDSLALLQCGLILPHRGHVNPGYRQPSRTEYHQEDEWGCLPMLCHAFLSLRHSILFLYTPTFLHPLVVSPSRNFSACLSASFPMPQTILYDTYLPALFTPVVILSATPLKSCIPFFITLVHLC